MRCCLSSSLTVWCRAAKDKVRQDHAPHPQKDRQQVSAYLPH